MKPIPNHISQEETPWARLDHAFRTVLTVPKEALMREEAKEKLAKEQKKRKKKLA